MISDPFISATALAALFLILFAAERVVPMRKASCPLIRRLIVNIGISILAVGAAAAVVQPAAKAALGIAADREWGILHWIPLPDAAEFLVGFLLMDLTFYYWHLANHRIPWLWRFHNVHHIDPDLDVSTAFRFHCVEVVFSSGFRVIQIVLIGVSPFTFIAYELAFQMGTLFHHSNVRLPVWFERYLNYVLVTPRMHGIHHSEIRQEANSNFSVVFSGWDRLHQTLRLNVPQGAIAIGTPAYQSPGDNRFWRALVMPFRRQRQYWRRLDGLTREKSEGFVAAPPGRLCE